MNKWRACRALNTVTQGKGKQVAQQPEKHLEEEREGEDVIDLYEGQDATAAIKKADDILGPVGKKKIIGGNAEVVPGVCGTPYS